MKKSGLWKWLPALVMMGIIFWVSAHTVNELPSFGWADKLVKKSGHAIGYAILALAYWYALGLRHERRWLAWALAILYALTDEYHQSFAAGRHSTIWDVLIFDNAGALIGLWLTNNLIKQKRPDEST